MPKLQPIQNTTAQFIRMPRLSDTVPLCLLFLVSRCSLMGISSFAVSMFASVFDLSIGLPALAVVILGILSTGAMAESVKYISAMLLFWLYSRLKTDFRDNTMMSASVCGVCVFLCGTVQGFYLGSSIYTFMILTIESMVAAAFYVFFEKASLLLTYSKRAPSEQELISAAICMGVFISGISDISIFGGFNLSKIITSYAILVIAYNLPLAVAGSCGVAAGLVCSMNNVDAITMMGLYGISAMLANLLKSFGKLGAAIGFTGGCAAIIMFVGNNISYSAIEIVMSGILFVLTPNNMHKAMGLFLNRTAQSEIISVENKIKEYLCTRLSNTRHAFEKMASIYRGATQRRINLYTRDICTVIDHTVDRVCSTCPRYSQCIGSEQADTYRIMFNILERIENSGFCSMDNAPSGFRSMCDRGEMFLCEFAHSYELYKRDTIRQGEFVNNRDLLLRQYEEIAETLGQFYEEISRGFSSRGDLEEKISAQLLRCGIAPRDIRVFENSFGEIEVFLSVNKTHSKHILSEQISKCTGMEMEYTNTISGTLMRFCPATIFDVEFGMHQIAKGREIISGDSLTSFRAGVDKYYVILCDGMGTGVDAGKESRITIRLLEELLRSGFSPKTAVELVNSSLAMGIENECFSSVDLLSINLSNGNADFYKVGSCKSFVKHKNTVETIFSPSLPVGILPGVHVSCISKRLEAEDIIIMISDGAEGNSLGFLSSERMKKLIADNKTMDHIAASVIDASVIKGVKKIRDDMTAAAIRIIKKQ